MKLYAYCVVAPGIVEDAPIEGLFGQKVDSLKVRDLEAVVSEFDGELVPITRDNILVHQQVIKTVLERKTPLPFRFGTLVSRTALTSYLEVRYSALRDKLTLVDGCVEMSIKVIWQETSEAPTDDRSNDQAEVSQGAGTAFLRSKARAITGNQNRIDDANAIASWLKSGVETVARDTRFTVRPSHRMVLSADCLVERSQLESYRLALQSAREQRPDLHFLTSGPWPPYSFANIDLEFKTHFGVS